MNCLRKHKERYFLNLFEKVTNIYGDEENWDSRTFACHYILIFDDTGSKRNSYFIIDKYGKSYLDLSIFFLIMCLSIPPLSLRRYLFEIKCSFLQNFLFENSLIPKHNQ